MPFDGRHGEIGSEEKLVIPRDFPRNGEAPACRRKAKRAGRRVRQASRRIDVIQFRAGRGKWTARSQITSLPSARFHFELSSRLWNAAVPFDGRHGEIGSEAEPHGFATLVTNYFIKML